MYELEPIVVPADLEVRSKRSGGPEWPVVKQLWEKRSELLSMVSCSSDFGAVVQELRERLKSDAAALNYRVVVPPEAIAALRKGEWVLNEASDGQGLLPIIRDQTGKFKMQVRLRPQEIARANPGSLSNAMSHAATHAMLRQILKKLDEMDDKLDRVLENQRSAWQARVGAGIRQTLNMQVESGKRSVLGTAIFELDASIDEGVRQLRSKVKRIPKPTGFFGSLWPRAKRTKDVYAEIIDEAREDVRLLQAGAFALARLHELEGQPVVARQVLPNLSVGLAETLDVFGEAFQLSRYSYEREAFWSHERHSLEEPAPRQIPEIAMEFEVHELFALTDEHARAVVQ